VSVARTEGYVPAVARPAPSPVAVAAVGLVLAAMVVVGHELGGDRGEVVTTRVVAERQDGKSWRYAVESGGEFAVRPIAGLLHGYPRVGDTTEVRVASDGRHTWNAIAARFPLTVILGLLSFWGGIALALRSLRGPA
jgi:hypothetical protein